MNIKQLGIIFNEILEYQMDNVPLAKTTAVYKLAEKGLSMLTPPLDNKAVDGEVPTDVKKFIVWLNDKSEWYYESAENLWVQDGYKSRTTDELYQYYNEYIKQSNPPK